MAVQIASWIAEDGCRMHKVTDTATNTDEDVPDFELRARMMALGYDELAEFLTWLYAQMDKYFQEQSRLAMELDLESQKPTSFRFDSDGKTVAGKDTDSFLTSMELTFGNVAPVQPKPFGI